jgi:hypothetical protein
VIVIQGDVFAVYAAGELGAGYLDLRVLVAGDASVGEGNSP